MSNIPQLFDFDHEFEVDLESPAPTDSGAQFDASRAYRYRLWRRWGDGPAVAFIGLNPSTADEAKDDPTIRRCAGFAKRFGCGGMEMLNLFALRSTDPAKLRKAQDPVGPDNNGVIFDVSCRCQPVIACWGAHGAYLGRDVMVMRLLRGPYNGPLMCLGKTKVGHPRHPLYLPADAPLVHLTSAQESTQPPAPRGGDPVVPG